MRLSLIWPQKFCPSRKSAASSLPALPNSSGYLVRFWSHWELLASSGYASITSTETALSSASSAFAAYAAQLTLSGPCWWAGGQNIQDFGPHSAKIRQSKRSLHVLAVGCEDVDFGVVRRNVTGVVIQIDPGTDEAIVPITVVTAILGLAVHGAGVDPVFFLLDAVTEILPKILGSHNNPFFRPVFAGWADGINLIVGGREFDVDFEEKRVTTVAIIELGLLGAVAAGGTAGNFDDLRQWGEQVNFRDIGAGFGKREMPGVGLEERAGLLIVTLAEEVGFAHGGIREVGVVSNERREKEGEGKQQERQ